MMRRKKVIYNEKGYTEFDFSRIENKEAIEGLAGYLVRKIPRDCRPNIVVGFVSDNTSLSRVVANYLGAKHYFVPQESYLKATVERFNGDKKMKILVVKALVSDADMDEWYYLPQINENIQRLIVACIADGRFFPYENHLDIFNLIDYENIHT